MVYVEIRKGMPGLKQAGKIAHDRLRTHLKKYGYNPVPRTPALWKHESRKIIFSLVVDDFGVKYVRKEDAQHLINALKDLYEITTDWSGRKYCGLNFEWDYKARTVTISMPGYIEKTLKKFKHPTPTKKQNAPHRWDVPVYGQKIQYAKDEKDLPLLPAKEINRCQQITGTLLYYAIAVDPTMLVALSEISATQSKATSETKEKLDWLLDYAASQPISKITYKASNMILHVHSDASYLSAPKARSRVGGHFFLNLGAQDPSINGPIHAVCKILKNVVSSAAEAEIAAMFENCKEATVIRTTLQELGHPQPPTPIYVDNTTAYGFANESIKIKRTKAIDMRYHWVVDRCKQDQFKIHLKPSKQNLADYFTKHHPPTHHKHIRPLILHENQRLKTTSAMPATEIAAYLAMHLLRGCAKIPGNYDKT